MRFGIILTLCVGAVLELTSAVRSQAPFDERVQQYAKEYERECQGGRVCNAECRELYGLLRRGRIDAEAPCKNDDEAKADREERFEVERKEYEYKCKAQLICSVECGEIYVELSRAKVEVAGPCAGLTDR
jgi:hypothetical protein